MTLTAWLFQVLVGSLTNSINMDEDASYLAYSRSTSALGGTYPSAILK